VGNKDLASATPWMGASTGAPSVPSARPSAAPTTSPEAPAMSATTVSRSATDETWPARDPAGDREPEGAAAARSTAVVGPPAATAGRPAAMEKGSSGGGAASVFRVGGRSTRVGDEKSRT
jgi:hypothetical protein